MKKQKLNIMKFNSKKLQNNLLKRLQVLKIPHSIIVSKIKMKNVSDSSGLDYCIAIPRFDKKIANELGIMNRVDHREVFTKTMSNQDITFFKNMKNNYNSVISNEDGNIYEWNKKSLKQSVNKYK